VAYLRPVGVGGVEVGDGGVDGGVELGVDEEGEAGAGDVREGADEVVAVDGGEAVAAGVDEEALKPATPAAARGSRSRWLLSTAPPQKA
jgi:hypothetical protein